MENGGKGPDEKAPKRVKSAAPSAVNADEERGAPAEETGLAVTEHQGGEGAGTASDGDEARSEETGLTESRPAEGPGSTSEERMLAIRLPVFEGPLDLLLHLVREHRLDIFDIPIAFITQKYLDFIERMRELNLDVAGEFLVMAATLAHIKSRMLLPRPEPEEGADEEGLEGDPRADLVRRLLEYQKYKEAAGSLGSQDILDRDVFTRRARADVPQVEGEIGLRQVSVFRLIEALDEVLSRAKSQVSHEVVRERFSLSERLSHVLSILTRRERMRFTDLFEGQAEKHAIVMTFLAILEMSRLGLARILQEELEGEIMVDATERAKEASPDQIRDDFR